MSLTVTESQAVFDLLRWLAETPRHDGIAGVERRVSDDEAVEALMVLATAAGRRLQISPDAKLPARIVERLQAVASDGAAQALARAADRAGYIPAPLRAALEAWRAAQDVELGERLRDQTVGGLMALADDVARHNADLKRNENERSRHDLLHVGPPPSEGGEVVPAVPERPEAGRDRGPGAGREVGARMSTGLVCRFGGVNDGTLRVCCSSHGDYLCAHHYARTHFVETMPEYNGPSCTERAAGATDDVIAAARKVYAHDGHYPSHLGDCIGVLSEPSCECGIADLAFAVRRLNVAHGVRG